MILEYIQLLLISTIVGGMLTFQVLFAPMVFIKLSEEVARPFIRKFFPFYYLYFALLSLMLAVVNYFLIDKSYGIFQLVFSIVVLIGFIVSRQVFMPMANKATDQGRKEDFTRYHRITVLINSLQLIVMLIALALV